MKVLRIFACCCVVAAGCVTMAGCGGDSKGTATPPDEIIERPPEGSMEFDKDKNIKAL